MLNEKPFQTDDKIDLLCCKLELCFFLDEINSELPQFTRNIKADGFGMLKIHRKARPLMLSRFDLCMGVRRLLPIYCFLVMPI